jgi:hypothetical protein
VTVVLRVERAGSPARSLPLVGHWRRSPDGPLHFAVDGELLDGHARLPTSGEVVVWPRRVFGGIVGLHRIALDVTVGHLRLRLDGDVGPPPYLRGLALPGRLYSGRRELDVRVSIDVVQLLALWLDLTAARP